MELRAKATVFAEGCRGSLTKEVMPKLGLTLTLTLTLTPTLILTLTLILT
jgi:flavin-dependent dehydrogenase